MAESAIGGISEKMNKFDSIEQVSEAVAPFVSALSSRFVDQKGSFTVVFSGGTLFEKLRKLYEPPYVDSIEWSKWHVFFIDERVVPLDHVDSNYKLAYDEFLSKVPIPSANIYAIDASLSAEEAAENYEAGIKQLVEKKIIKVSEVSGFPSFDLILTGMGPDGHVGSLFCWHFQRYEKKRWVTFIKDSPKPPSNRITFTFPVINSSSFIAFVVTGVEVAHAVKVALGNSCCGHIPLPVQMVSAEEFLTWFLDKDASMYLSEVNARPVCLG